MSHEELTDHSIMSFGQHKGKKLIQVPGSYLLWAYDNIEGHQPLKNYIKENMDVLKQEQREEFLKRKI